MLVYKLFLAYLCSRNRRKLSVTRTCKEWPLAYETEHKTFTKMKNEVNRAFEAKKKELNAETMAQIAIDQIEENDIVTILSEVYDTMPNIDPEDSDGSHRDYDRYFAANRISRANKSLLDKYKRIVCGLMRGAKGSEPCTKVIGTRMFKLYYILSYTWQNLRLPDKPEEEKTDKDRQIDTPPHCTLIVGTPIRQLKIDSTPQNKEPLIELMKGSKNCGYNFLVAS